MNWMVFFLMLPHLKPACLDYLWPGVEAAFNAGRVVSAVVILFLYLLKRRRPSAPVWVLAALQGWLLVVTAIQAKDSLQSAWVSALSILAVALLIDFFSRNVRALLRGLMLNMEILIYANLLTVILTYPQGMYVRERYSGACYFLGYHNRFILYVLPAIVVALLYASTRRKRLRAYCLIGAGVLSVCITWSATSLCGLLVFLLVLILSHTVVKKWITYPTIFAATVTIDLLISAFRVMDRVLWIAAFIESFLKKEVTLTGRTFVWDSFYLRFFDSPWIGYGKHAEAIVGTYLEAHNQWFQFLLEGGIPCLTLFLLFNFVIGKRLMRFSKSPNVYLFYAVLSAFYIIFIGDTYLNDIGLYILYIMAYHVDKFEAASPVRQAQSRLFKRGYYVPNRKLPEKH